MAGDYTRFTHRPERDRSGVLMQQGRVQLDADWNELVEIVNRRTRVESVDVIGRCGVPTQTEHGFEIGGSVAAGLTIGIGRCYVDGLLAENRGAGEDWLHEPIWGERVHPNPTSYKKQPYLKSAPDPPGGPGPHLVYLDVWEREIGPAEDPELIDSAVGVDTATRLQTVWAVRILEDAGGKGCDPDWEALPATRSSGARLSAVAHGVSEPEDPCHVAPLGGYRGVDNRLYRVEIHDDGGEEGQRPSFKWSRDNASITTRASLVDQLADGGIKVSVRRIGHDRTLRFREGDWVELLDDECEPAGRAGVMARIAPEGVDEQAGELTLESLSGPLGDGANLRLRRWDQQEGVDELRGAVPFDRAGQTFELEDGIEVTLECGQPGGCRVGDHWVFAARASEEGGTIDSPPAEEPPRGPRHHYCALAVLKSGVPSDDCRVMYPPEPPPTAVEDGCACDVCVTPKSHEDGSLTIQAAVDRVSEAGGGRVCLAVGVYELREPVRIGRARSLMLSGKGMQTQLVYRGEAEPALEIAGSTEVTVEGLAITAAGGEVEAETAEPLIAIRGASGTTIQRCFLGTAGSGDLGGVRGGGMVDLRGTVGVAIELAGSLPVTVIRENVIAANRGVVVRPEPRPDTEEGVKASLAGLITFGLWIEDNMVWAPDSAIDLGMGAQGKQADPLCLHLGETWIAGNTILDCAGVGIQVGGLVGPDDDVLKSVAAQRKLDDEPPPVAGFSGRLELVRNEISVSGVGVRVGCERTRIGDNEICWKRPQEQGSEEPPSAGIEVQSGAAGEWALRDLEISGNRVRDFGGGGIEIDCVLESAAVRGNTVRDVRGAGVGVNAIGSSGMVDPAQGTDVTLHVEGNDLLDVGGRFPAVFVRAVEGRVSVADNHCRMTNPSRLGVISLEPGGAHLVVSNNQMRGGRRLPSLTIQRGGKGELQDATVLGNVADGPYVVNGTPELPPPWRELNLPN